LAKEVHGGRGAYGEVGNGVVHGLVVDVEDDMGAAEVFAPAQDSVHDCKHFHDLDMLLAILTWALDGEPACSEESPETLGTAGVRVDVQGTALWADKADTVPLLREGCPPIDVAASGFGEATPRERCHELHLEVVEPMQEGLSRGDHLRRELQEAREFLQLAEGGVRAARPFTEKLLEVDELFGG
jgi:hypothetical protein